MSQTWRPRTLSFEKLLPQCSQKSARRRLFAALWRGDGPGSVGADWLRPRSASCSSRRCRH